MFKRIFGYPGNEQITKDLLKSITNENITDITLDCNPITPKDLKDDKIGILDIKAKLNNSINCNIEMQMVDQSNIEKRILFYWSKMYTSSIKSGLDYDKLEKGILILFTDYNIENFKSLNKYITKWKIREEENPKIILTDVLEIYIIELSKFNIDVNNNSKNNNSLNMWLNFINSPKAVLNMENKAVKQARAVLENISQNEHERYLAELREKHIMDQKAIRDAGFIKGKKEGFSQSKLEIAKKMKDENIEISVIEKVTGLTQDEIENL